MEGKKQDCLSRVAGRQEIIRVLAAAGVGPREKCAGMILGGRVAVNGRISKSHRVRVDPLRDQLTLDGQAIPQSL